MQIEQNVPLAPYTSFGVGGLAEYFIEVHDTEQLLKLLQTGQQNPAWLLGYGSNSLISDKGLPGLVVCIKGGTLNFDSSDAIVDAGVWWDDVVAASLERGLWGVELMSEIPGSVGAALFINISAYGQSIGSLVEWIDVWNPETKQVERLEKAALSWSYKNSVFQRPGYEKFIILRACLRLSHQKKDELVYQKALDVSSELKLDPNDLKQRREIIIEARNRAGSLWHPYANKPNKTVGSFFRNPLLSEELANSLFSFDESGQSSEHIRRMSLVHGGNSRRVSASLVMLAAGFKRGQRWGRVKLNDQNLLKIEALDGATAQDIFNVSRTIQKTVKEKLGIGLQPEAQILGSFEDLSSLDKDQ